MPRHHVNKRCKRASAEPPTDFDLCIDALLGMGTRLDPDRAGTALMLQWLALMHASAALRLSVDVPTGLDADTGATTLIAHNAHSIRHTGLFTLSLISLKPGLFTAAGRDHAGQVWFDDLGIDCTGTQPCAWLLGADGAALVPRSQALHNNHKGNFGDVAIVGGESAADKHMTGAALLAARAALHAGAGRVFVALLGKAAESLSVDWVQPELMFRNVEALDIEHQVVVCGCGGGEAVKTVLAQLLSAAPRLVLDANALNAIAADSQLQIQLKSRHVRGYSTVLTPHPLEAARLAACGLAEVQANRLATARQLAEQFQCVVVLKGSGTVIAAPDGQTFINYTGNALLSTAGTGDVLAGILGAYLANYSNSH